MDSPGSVSGGGRNRCKRLGAFGGLDEIVLLGYGSLSGGSVSGKCIKLPKLSENDGTSRSIQTSVSKYDFLISKNVK